jgi:hypothetical protein
LLIPTPSVKVAEIQLLEYRLPRAQAISIVGVL